MLTFDPARILTNDGSNWRLYACVDTSFGSCAETRDDVGLVKTKVSVIGVPMGAGPLSLNLRLGTDTTSTLLLGTPSHFVPPIKSFPSPVLWYRSTEKGTAAAAAAAAVFSAAMRLSSVRHSARSENDGENGTTGNGFKRSSVAPPTSTPSFPIPEESITVLHEGLLTVVLSSLLLFVFSSLYLLIMLISQFILFSLIFLIISTFIFSLSSLFVVVEVFSSSPSLSSSSSSSSSISALHSAKEEALFA